MLVCQHVGNLQSCLLNVRSLRTPKSMRPLGGKVFEDY